MHESYAEKSTNILSLINEFDGFAYDTDYGGRLTTDGVKITSKVFSNYDEAGDFVTSTSYYSDYAYLAAYTTKKLSKGYQNAFSNFLIKHDEWKKFEDNLTISYGRKSTKATCPTCGSSISLKYGHKFKECPVCDSKKIISDSNWKILETKRRLMEKAAENLSKEAIKNEVTFVCGLEWHC